MDKRKRNSRRRFEWWFKRRHNKPHLSGLTDSSGLITIVMKNPSTFLGVYMCLIFFSVLIDESDDNGVGMGAVCVRSMEIEPCFPDDELRLLENLCSSWYLFVCLSCRRNHLMISVLQTVCRNVERRR